jgi:integrase
VANNLVRYQQTWHVQIAVPRKHQAAVGQKLITRSLKTESVTVARRRAPAMVAVLRAELAQRIEAAGLPADSPEQLVQGAREQRRAVTEGRMTEDQAEAGFDAMAEEYLERLRRKRGAEEDPASPNYGYPPLTDQEAATLRRADDILNGTEQESLTAAIKRHLAADKPRITAKEYGQKVRRLGDFAAWHGADRPVSTLTKKIAGNYMDVIRATGGAHKTLVKWTSNLRAFGAFCERHGLLQVNPWDGFHLQESTRGGVKPRRRHYTVEEFGKLVGALAEHTKGSPLLPLSLLSAYSGCRIEELCAMKLAHVTDETLFVAEGKTTAAVRHVPIHPVIAPIVAKLKATSKDGYLISGLIPGGPDHTRSAYPVKKFGRFLRKHVTEDPNLTFHSLRKSFTQRAMTAGIPEPTVDVITGHKLAGMSYGVYADAPDFPVWVEAVRKVTYGPTIDETVRGLADRCVITEKGRRKVRRPAD